MMSTVIGRSLANVRANDVWSNPRHVPGTMMNSVSSWLVTKRTSLSRQIGSTGFWTAPKRASATITTIVSSVVGSCHVTTVPSVTPLRKGPPRSRRRVTKLLAGEAAAEVIGEYHPSWVLAS